MTIKLHAIDRWKVLAPGAAVLLENTSDTGRRVRLHVNCAAPTTFYLEDFEGARLLASVPAGLETIEFSVAGKIAVFAQEGAGEVHYQTAESEPTFARVVDPVIFTKLAQRRHRNPELEEMMFRMQSNMERRLAAQANEIAAALEARMEARNGSEAPTSGAPAGDAGGTVPAQEPDGSQPGEDAGSEDAGEQPGSAGG